MGDGYFPISDEKRQTLRALGVVPFSRDFGTFAVVVGSALAMSLLFYSAVPSLVSSLTSATQASFSSESAESIKLLLSDYFLSYFKASLAYVGCLVGVVLLLGSIQNSFLFRLNLIFAASDKRRPTAGARARSRGLLIFAGSISKVFVLCMIGVLLLFPLFDSMMISVLPRLFHNLVSQIERPEIFRLFLRGAMSYFSWFIAALICYTFAVGVVSLFFSKIQYELDHRMRREEVDAEMQEQMSPTMIAEFSETITHAENEDSGNAK